MSERILSAERDEKEMKDIEIKRVTYLCVCEVG